MRGDKLMGLLNTVKNFMGFDDDYEDENLIDEIEEQEDTKKRRFTRPVSTSKVVPITSRNEDANVQIIKPSTFGMFNSSYLKMILLTYESQLRSTVSKLHRSFYCNPSPEIPDVQTNSLLHHPLVRLSCP